MHAGVKGVLILLGDSSYSRLQLHCIYIAFCSVISRGTVVLYFDICALFTMQLCETCFCMCTLE